MWHGHPQPRCLFKQTLDVTASYKWHFWRLCARGWWGESCQNASVEREIQLPLFLKPLFFFPLSVFYRGVRLALFYGKKIARYASVLRSLRSDIKNPGRIFFFPISFLLNFIKLPQQLPCQEKGNTSKDVTNYGLQHQALYNFQAP